MTTPVAAAAAVTTRLARGAGAASIAGDAAPRLMYRPELDGLRGVAVLGVMAYHFGVPGAQHGFLGVDVFFVLSGYLITSILAAEWQRAGSIDVGRFYGRRALRLLPALVLMLAIVGPTVSLPELAASLGYVMNLAMAFDWMPLSRPLGHTWSLAVEEQFYLVWPLVITVALARWSPRSVGRGMLVAGLLVAGWRAIVWATSGDWVRVFAGTDTHTDGLLIGSALALSAFRIPRWASTAGVVFAGSLVVVPALSMGTFATVGDLAAVFATAAIISRPIGVLAFRPLVAIGRISYGLYLWHVPMLTWLADRGVAAPMLAFALTFSAAALSWRYVESPLLRLRHAVDPDRAGLDVARR